MTLTINTAPALATLTKLANNPLRPWMQKVAESESERVKRRILAIKTDPDMRPWAPWAPSTAYARLRKGNSYRGLLYDEGLLLASVISRSSDTEVEVGIDSAVDYAKFLQEGTDRMPARPYLGWSGPSLALLEVEAAIFLAQIR
jgi:phage gpG-like protein